MSEPQVTSLQVVKAKPREDVAEVLKRLTEMNERGELNGLAFVAQHTDQATEYESVGVISHAKLIGGLEILKLDLLKEWERLP